MIHIGMQYESRMTETTVLYMTSFIVLRQGKRLAEQRKPTKSLTKWCSSIISILLCICTASYHGLERPIFDIDYNKFNFILFFLIRSKFKIFLIGNPSIFFIFFFLLRGNECGILPSQTLRLENGLHRKSIVILYLNYKFRDSPVRANHLLCSHSVVP